MKRTASLLLVLALAGVILLPVTTTFNNHSSNRLSTADGGPTGPIPPWPPCAYPTTGISLAA